MLFSLYFYAWMIKAYEDVLIQSKFRCYQTISETYSNIFMRQGKQSKHRKRYDIIPNNLH